MCIRDSVNTAQKGDQINDIMKNKEVKLDVKDYWELYKWYIPVSYTHLDVYKRQN